jgi:hypothetical protein
LLISQDVLRFTTKKNKDWFIDNNKEIQEMLAQKILAHQAQLAQLSCPVKKAAFCFHCNSL